LIRCETTGFDDDDDAAGVLTPTVQLAQLIAHLLTHILKQEEFSQSHNNNRICVYI